MDNGQIGLQKVAKDFGIRIPETPEGGSVGDVDSSAIEETSWQPFPTDLLPEIPKRFIRAAASSIGVDDSYVALPVLAIAAGCIGSTRLFCPNDGWPEPAVLWAMTVGQPGSKKSRGTNYAIEPLQDLDREWRREHESKARAYEEEALIFEEHMKTWKRDGAKTGEMPDRPVKPYRKRILYGDATMEALRIRLANHARGGLCYRPEAASWVKGFDAYRMGKGGDAQLWIELYEGDQSHRDRVGDDGESVIERACCSVVGTIQPEIIRKILFGEHMDSGLSLRIMLTDPPYDPQPYSRKQIPLSAKADYARMIRKLTETEPDREGQSVRVPFSVEAEDLFEKLYNSLISDLRETFALFGPEALGSLEKSKGLAVRIAGVLHEIRIATGDTTAKESGEIDRESTIAGWEIARWIHRERLRFMEGLATDPGLHELHKIHRWIRDDLGGEITVGQLRHRRRGRFADEKEAADFLAMMVQEIGGSLTRSPSGPGRPTQTYRSLPDTGVGV